MKTQPKVAIVILNWNGRKFLQQFLPSVLKSTYSHLEIIVADNHSTDDSVQFLATDFPKIRIIHIPENRGYAGGYNASLRQVEADYYVLLNSDVEVTPQWLEPMVELLEKNKRIAACQPKILSWYNRNLFEYAGAAGGWIDRFGYPFCKGRVFDEVEEDHDQYDSQEPIFWASGAALFVRSESFHAVGGLDEYFFAHQEEIDLCWRLQSAGYKIYSCPDSVVYHVGGATLPRGNPKKTFLNFRNNLIMLAKNLPPVNWWIFPVRMVLDAAAAFRGLLSGDAGYFLAVLKAYAGFFFWLLFKKSKSVFPRFRKVHPEGITRKSIIWQYYIRKKKKFSELAEKRESVN